MLIPVVDLVGSPGATKSLRRSIAAEDVGDDPWGPAADALTGELTLDLGLDSVVEGIYVHGTIAWPVTLRCDRCLRGVDLQREVTVGELFADPRRAEAPDDVDEGYTLVDGGAAIDLERLLHDQVVLDLPTSVRCERDDCEVPPATDVTLLSEDEHRGIVEDEPDPRWAKLAELDLSQN